MQVEQGLLALLGEDLPFGVAPTALLYLSPPHGQDLRSFVADLSDVGVALLEKHPLAAVQDDLVAKLDPSLATKLVLNIPHAQYPRMEW